MRAGDSSRLSLSEQQDVIHNPTRQFSQQDGADAFVEQSGDRYDVVVRARRGAITNLRIIRQKKPDSLIRNYGWTEK
jgi:hypothetical protein